MSINLSLLPPDQKNRIELDKQAAFLVWKVKQGKAVPADISTHRESIRLEAELLWFDQSIEKYKQEMGVSY